MAHIRDSTGAGAAMAKKNEQAASKTADKSFPAECRAFGRYPCELPGVCSPVRPRTGPDPELSWGAHVRDISIGGISLDLVRRFEPGTPLLVELPETAPSSVRSLGVRVAHVRSNRGVGWIIGCE